MTLRCCMCVSVYYSCIVMMTHSCTVERSYMCMCVLCDVMREVWERFVCVGRASFRHLSHVVLQVAIHQAVCLEVTRHGLE